MTDVMSMSAVTAQNQTERVDDTGCETQEAEMNGVANLPEETKSTASKEQTKTTGKARKRERPQKNADASITEVDNMNDVGNLADDTAETDVANVTDVALKQEVLVNLLKIVLQAFFRKR